jgi:hypothetical protein
MACGEAAKIDREEKSDARHRLVRATGPPNRCKGRPRASNARAYILTLPELDPRWQSVARKLLIACEDGEVEAVTRQIEFALLTHAKFVLR